jgi:hypothetical protein
MNAKRLKDLIKKNPEPARGRFGINPMDPWSAKYGIAEDNTNEEFIIDNDDEDEDETETETSNDNKTKHKDNKKGPNYKSDPLLYSIRRDELTSH